MGKSAVFVVFLCIINQVQVCFSSSVEQNSKVVQIHSGLVKGYKNSEWDIFAFYGIPYATAPSGREKFKGPLPAPHWSDTLEAIDKTIVCAQHAHPTGHDNCLTSNVFTPNTNDTNLPVLVYIHGGAFYNKSGNHLLPYSLVKDGNLVTVTFNYRLGMLGFLCLGTEGIPGNAGLKDMVALLNWVNQNIANFGGNPDDVTIAGCSAGSVSAELLALSETTKGLFNKVILQSGNSIESWSVQQNPLEIAQTHAMKMNFDISDDLHALEEFYTNRSTEELVKHTHSTIKDKDLYFVPCLERHTGTEAVLTTAPLDTLKSETFKKYPTLIGFANMEGLYRLQSYDDWKDDIQSNLAYYFPVDLKFNTSDEQKEAAKSVKELYFDHDDFKQGFIDYFSDAMFVYPLIRAINYQVEAGNEDVYYFEFSFVEDSKVPTDEPYNVHGAGHCTQSEIVFERPEPVAHSSDYFEMKKKMTALWINFIKTGKPVPNASSVFPDGWPAASPTGSYMEMNLRPRLRKNWRSEYVSLWNDIYSRYYITPIPAGTGV
ncbi:cholinesterase 1 [Plutella xylostella]|uniref:cholinesterase 1 n=1 Tax=Plutella xylostella TaxID=51655 RepID=UPI0020323A45|nr:cholinesterase 1 [Plutella xylostella]